MTTATHRGLAPVREVAPNGAVIIAKESSTTPAVTIHAAFYAGTIYDPPDRAGVAHFVSRTLDRGTESRTADQIGDEVDGRGAALSVTVNRHGLSLICTCLVEDLAAMLELIADIAMHATYPEQEVATRRGEIVTLIRQDEDNPSSMATEGLMADLYGDMHPYGRRPRGSLDSVEAIDRTVLRRYHADRIRPGTLSLVMVGDVAPDRAIDAAKRALEGWSAPSPTTISLAPISAATQRRVRVLPMMNKAQTDVAYGFITIARHEPTYYAHWLMNNILGQYSLGGRLGDTIRERQGMAYYVFSALDANVIPGPLIIRAGVSPANVERAVASIDSELTRLASEGPTEAELKESKQYLIGSMPRTLETNLGIANYLQTEEFFGLGLDYDLRVPDLLNAVTREGVYEAARAVLDPSRATIVVAGPFAGELR